MSAHQITPSFSIHRAGPRLRVYTGHKKPILMVQGETDLATAAALRALADEIERDSAPAKPDLEQMGLPL